MNLYKIDAGNFMADGGALFGIIPKVMWKDRYACNDANYCNLTMRCLLIEFDDRKILIDTGGGSKQSDKFYSYHHLNGDASLISSLEGINIHPDEITDVILTHLHWDHCGGCVDYHEKGNAIIVFKNANHWVGKDQWNNYTSPNMREAAVYFPENMMPVNDAGLLRLVDSDSFIIPNVEVRLFNGHTKGNMLPIIHTPKGPLAFMGDVIPVLPSIRLPWVSAYDTEPLQSIDDKCAFLQEAIEKDITLFFEHDLYNECCKLSTKENAIVAQRLFTLNEFMNS